MSRNLTDDTLYDVLTEFKNNLFFELKVADLGIITSYDKVSNLAKILPLNKDRVISTKEERLKPQLSNVSIFGREPSVGELCIVLYLDKTPKTIISNFSFSDKKPFESYAKFIPSKLHNINNAVAICGVFSKDLQFTYEEMKFLKKNYGVIKKVILDNGGVE